MKPEQFAKGMWEIAVVEGLESYKDIYASSPDKATDPFYKSALMFYNTLAPDQKETLFAIIKQVEIDTTATILALIDGVSSFPGHQGDFHLTTKGSDKPINEDLSDLFLEIAEMDRGV